MVTQLQPDVRAYLHGGEVIKRYIRVEEVAHEYGFSVEETEYIAKAASSLYKLKLDNLAMDVRMDKEKNKDDMKHNDQMEADRKEAAPERVEAEIVYAPVVAETHEYQYNADAFEARGAADMKVEIGKEVSKVREDKAR